MELGLYNAKYSFRKVIEFLLPFFKEMNPNNISLAIIPIGIVTAFTYYFAAQFSLLYLIGILLIFIRMIVGTLDGMVAEQHHKQTANGSIINRLAPEAADMILMLAIILASPKYFLLGMFALVASWAISYSGIVGLVGAKKIQSVGPVGQTDRLVALMVFSGLQFANIFLNWNFDFIKMFLWWVVIGGLLTIILRCFGILKSNK